MLPKILHSSCTHRYLSSQVLLRTKVEGPVVSNEAQSGKYVGHPNFGQNRTDNRWPSQVFEPNDLSRMIRKSRMNTMIWIHVDNLSGPFRPSSGKLLRPHGENLHFVWDCSFCYIYFQCTSFTGFEFLMNNFFRQIITKLVGKLNGRILRNSRNLSPERSNFYHTCIAFHQNMQDQDQQKWRLSRFQIQFILPWRQVMVQRR